MVTKEVMEKIVKSCRAAMREARKNTSMTENLFDEIYGDLLDGIYLMLGEKTNELEDSISFTVINSTMSDEECATVLAGIMESREMMLGAAGSREYLAGPPAFENGPDMVVGYQYLENGVV